MDNKSAFSLLSRYVLLVLLAFNGLSIIYYLFTPLTIYPVLFLLKTFYGSATLVSNNISFSTSSVSITEACVAGAAYYLLLILNLTTPMPAKKRLKSLIFLLSSFLIINIIRIISFAALFDSGFKYFDLSHTIVWHLGSTIFLIAIWFACVKIYDIKDLPVITDIKEIYKTASKNKRIK